MDRSSTPLRSITTERAARELLARWSTQNLLDPAVSSGVRPAPLPVDASISPQHPGSEIPSHVDAASGDDVQSELTSFPLPVSAEAIVHSPNQPVSKTDEGSSHENIESSLQSSSIRRFDAPHNEASRIRPPAFTRFRGRRPTESHSNQSSSRLEHQIEPEATYQSTSSLPQISESKVHRQESMKPIENGVSPRLHLPMSSLTASRTTLSRILGQLCAYSGVVLLTIGTGIILSGQFGAPVSLAPKGWVVAAVGQMCLFLGIILLVSGGMEQTVEEVSWRIDSLADQLEEIEEKIQSHKRPDISDRQKQNLPPKNRRADAA